jgi:hypothetical protein
MLARLACGPQRRRTRQHCASSRAASSLPSGREVIMVPAQPVDIQHRAKPPHAGRFDEARVDKTHPTWTHLCRNSYDQTNQHPLKQARAASGTRSPLTLGAKGKQKVEHKA